MPSKIDLPRAQLDEEFSPEVIPKIYADFLAKEDAKKNLQADNIKRLAISEKYTVYNKIREIIKHLLKKPKFVFNTLFSISKCNREELVTAFSGLLELSRRNRVITEQERMFGDIVVKKFESTDNTMNMSNMDDFKELEEGK